MTAEQKEAPRLLTPAELAQLVRLCREMRQWSQETLAALSGLSVRTIQRVEKGEPSDLDSRRALARAFDAEDIDVFNKACNIPTPEEVQAQQEKFHREHWTLDCSIVKSGRQLTNLFEAAHCDYSSPSADLRDEPASDLAGLIDYLRDYRDCAGHYTETQKLVVYADIQNYLDLLATAGISVWYARRNTEFVGRDWVNKTPMALAILYLITCPKGNAPEKMVVPRQFDIS
jgi:transcriptional regulator with XRE-family HTH domain